MARPRSDVRARIVHAARARFLEEGVDGASLRGIARDAKTSIGMVYYYFPSKDALFLDVVEEIYVPLLESLSESLGTHHSVQERIEGLFARIGSLSDEEFVVVRLIIREVLVSSARRDKIIARFVRGHIPLVISTLRDGIESHTLSRELPPAVMMLSLASLAIFPQIIRRLLGELLPTGFAIPASQDLARVLARVALEGIAGQPASS